MIGYNIRCLNDYSWDPTLVFDRSRWHDWGIRCGRGGWFGRGRCTESRDDHHGAGREEQVGRHNRSLLLSILKTQKFDLRTGSQGRGKHPRTLYRCGFWNCDLGHFHSLLDLAHGGELNLSRRVQDRSYLNRSELGSRCLGGYILDRRFLNGGDLRRRILRLIWGDPDRIVHRIMGISENSLVRPD